MANFLRYAKPDLDLIKETLEANDAKRTKRRTQRHRRAKQHQTKRQRNKDWKQ